MCTRCVHSDRFADPHTRHTHTYTYARVRARAHSYALTQSHAHARKFSMYTRSNDVTLDRRHGVNISSHSVEVNRTFDEDTDSDDVTLTEHLMRTLTVMM